MSGTDERLFIQCSLTKKALRAAGTAEASQGKDWSQLKSKSDN